MNYDYRPIRQNYKAHALVVLLFLLSGVAFGSSGLWPEQRIQWQLMGLLPLLPAIRLIARYMASRYLYRLHVREDGCTDLEIFVYRGGERMLMVFRVGLGEILDAAPLSPRNARAPKGVKRHNYAQDLYPQRGLVLRVPLGEGSCEVLFCPDTHIIREIENALSASRASAPAEE